MTFLDAIILGIIQGLTEFLPVSSSGHIQLGEALLGLGEEHDSLSFTIIVHAATVLSTIVVFRKDIADLLRGVFSMEKESLTFAGKVVLSMVPAAAAGIFLEDTIDGWFGDNLTLVGVCLLVTATLLMLTSVAKPGNKKPSFGHILLIGISQAMAILPGVSRSGSTISTALYLGVDKERATRFSFLMVIPLILGATAKKILDGPAAGEAVVPAAILAAGFVAAFLAGWAACKWMVAIVKRGKLWYFAVYCVIVGLIAIFL